MNKLLKIETEIKSKYRIHYFEQLTEEDWIRISRYSILPEDFISKYKNSVDWNSISFKQILSENFIRYYKKFVNWKGISSSQTLSLAFIEEFKEFVDFESIYNNPQVSDDTKISLSQNFKLL
ncbi:MAG TPA: hypothetical protein QF753_20250 [Victivallales bacterium]|nr:hypothetical protein [Victivallales bacterium]